MSTILGAMAAGDSVEDILVDYPNLRKEDIEAAPEFASRLSDFQSVDVRGGGGTEREFQPCQSLLASGIGSLRRDRSRLAEFRQLKEQLAARRISR